MIEWRNFTIEDALDATAGALIAMDGFRAAVEAGSPFYEERMFNSTANLLCGVYRYLEKEFDKLSNSKSQEKDGVTCGGEIEAA